MDLALRVRHARQNAGMSQAELGRRVGVTRATISAWEAGHINNIRNAHLNALSKATGFEPTFFITEGTLEAAQRAATDTSAYPQGRPYLTLARLRESPSQGGVTLDEDDTETVPRKWLGLSRKSNPNYAWLTMPGDAMTRSIPEKSIMVVDQDDTQVRDGKLYALDDGGILRVALLRRLPQSRFEIRYDHPEYPPEQRSSDDATVLGRVIWAAIRY